MDALPQPDFHALSGHLQGMSLEIDRCANLVAVHNTNAILEAIAQLTRTVNTSVAQLRAEMQALRTDMTTLRAEMRADMATLRAEMRADMATLRAELRAELRTEIRSLEHRMEDVDFNGRARSWNSLVIRSSFTIQPLKNLATHEVVNVPSTLEELDRLRLPDIEHYLTALGEVPVGSVGEKMKQLKMFLGIPV
ncbi:hypothetical protein F5Y03DRAFT_334520 [Xylaria venustula]|nr:hypothetical protein F5Y03DRAFT_334520 [Xylaria venustula]